MKQMIDHAVKSLLEMQKDPLVIRDKTGVVQFGNQAAQTLYGEAWNRLHRRKAEWNAS